MTEAIVVLNAGSSSLKFSVFKSFVRAEPALLLRGQIEGLFTEPHFRAWSALGEKVAESVWSRGTELGHAGAVDVLNDFLAHQTADLTVRAYGHRVVHGGLKYSEPVVVDDQVLEDLARLTPLAPLHQPNNLQPIRTLRAHSPGILQLACFDTGFHRHQPLVAQIFALPYALTQSGIRRYGFHGISYEYIASVLPGIDPLAAAGKTVVFHLGNGASACAIDNGIGVATTFGFTAVEGLPMGTRCGALDPGVLLYLIDERGMDSAAIAKMLYKESGLLGISGLSSDMRVLEMSDDPRARLAVEYFCYRVGRELASLAAAMGGLDAIVFTAGIGENSAFIRERILEMGRWLGVEVDHDANSGRGLARISSAVSRVAVWVIPTDEELMIARHAQRALDVRDG
ncbi:acetate/propionate family kinase [Niveibacterium terrae]|uniref:acetate/propionate family kinase n=1 Tax=Niveibacterium terrae TaxID=3373598 RepID=UPI003A9423B4